MVQPLYRKQNLENYEQAKLQGLLAEQQLQRARQDLILRVANAYFAVLQAQDTITTLEAQKQAFAEQLAQAKKSFEVGTATIVDTNEAKARSDLTVAQELAAQNDLEVKRRSLEKIINREAPGLAALVQGAKIPLPQPADMDAWVKQAEESSLNVAVNQTALETARREVAKQRGGHYPTVDLTASYTDTRDSVYANFTGVNDTASMIGIQLALPLYQGGAVNSRVRQAVDNQEKARYQLDDARRQAVLDARQGFLGVESGAAQVRALEQALVSSQTQLDSTKLGLEVGVRTRVDVLNAEQQLYTTRQQLSAARYQTILAGLQLKAAAGTLSEADVKAVDALLTEQP
jgi:outer membrane protein